MKTIIEKVREIERKTIARFTARKEVTEEILDKLKVMMNDLNKTWGQLEDRLKLKTMKM